MTTLELTLSEQVRQQNPVVLTITNAVTPAKVADALSAIGASPIMSLAPQEANEMVTLANAITINLGTINKEQVEEITTVLKENRDQKPVVLDPVAVGASQYRLTVTKNLLQNYQFTVIRGNAGEIAALANVNWSSHGIDGGSGQANIHKIAKKVAQTYHCTVVLTGNTDIVTDGNNEFINHLSTNYFITNVGSGDMLSSITAAYLSVSDSPYLAACTATKFFTAAGVKAAREATGFGQWQVKLMDELTTLDPNEVLSFL
ncbi:hydroxyethylthiazole kinase [Limosilactobacillus fastidiosus]|uniref:Hydroxyethylthiazole kinase n=1 Tax=Limosilactobacillus fastidiosus TaxID=2759855 RepID=A0A7W3YCW7_9LACO|nr:hydroxyethylthiazole kinase [Limosilactobacillus fastidiosus]MBB1062714.1 hydroxyethylthiazole kinase [Limosilactobacillus fastidiosus]MBB1086551.1 hydroxyethylthiazole kinase [Limosilactobacillus fastidiosus]MCD7084873.1 hydroxyethylthiazole kinase [Limosilactobacillus fastidiosus]MCD7085306.1 hydroxyethylthiazole kinase [Limosilactobacillus fastidiosus]MCD7115139.1 hydroxyethylthiazole kinase [Limosilactobacillus fastidiosus]